MSCNECENDFEQCMRCFGKIMHEALDYALAQAYTKYFPKEKAKDEVNKS